MATWVFEPGHTAAEFRARHMMVSWVRGHFKDVHGSLQFDPDNPAELAIEATIQVNNLWTGEAQRDREDGVQRQGRALRVAPRGDSVDRLARGMLRN